jgi:hypothetical protein
MLDAMRAFGLGAGAVAQIRRVVPRGTDCLVTARVETLSGSRLMIEEGVALALLRLVCWYYLQIAWRLYLQFAISVGG